ncbi:alpha/beta fold hydrolase [Cyanobium sp. ATX 6F1]|uniref:alpha/beta fold hydrolase n=1 Tax=unclassified Cyanobium TaxID=2627006 RepID=UPI0020CB7E89|nr:alpha/beta fold hydrolase [Cyanobium sp. ATX 6F1]
MIDAQLLFLPGASGSTAFWQPLAERLTHPAERRFLGWPGFGPTPPDPAINSLTDLVDLVSGALDRPSALIAQSMGGVIALLTALKQPQSITHLVLIATSGGLAMAEHGAEDWRPAFMASQASVPPWFADATEDLTPLLPEIRMPTLLVWGDADPISPLSVGRKLEALLPRSKLRVIPGADHDLAFSHAAELAPMIEDHLATP